MATILKTEVKLDENYNFRHIAKLREKAQEDYQPVFDERFRRARVDYKLLGNILLAKHEKILSEEGKKIKDYNKIRPQRQLFTIDHLFSLISKLVNTLSWKTIRTTIQK